jgi:Tol biopolymer transport system component
MTPQKFRKIEALCQSVRQHGPEVLANVDSETRELVQSLLEQDPGLPSNPSVAETVTRSIQAPIGIGTQLGPYKLESVLGVGGMGQVFRAIDTRLARSVAIKTSYERFTDRFEREARTVAAVNHPYICTLHDVGPNYLVMELVEGETIAARLKKGKLSISDTLRYGMQIAEALAAAHARGITHRDLKPGNVMITKSGVKVLDFGLAKSSRDDTITASNVAMGTPAYMAPEQLEAKNCDARTDLYALGLLLFEMATGNRVAQGTLMQLESLPERLAHVVELCLANDPDKRWQDARDVRAELEWTAMGPVPARQSDRAPRVWPAVAGVLILGLATLAFVHFREAAPGQAVVHSTILPPEETSFDFATNLGPMALSPDGKRMVFAATGQDGKSQLWIRSLDSATVQRLPATDRAAFPFWSPDGLWVAFFADAKLKKIDTRGGTPVALAEASASNGNGGSWSMKGEIVFAATTFAPLLKISQDGGKTSLAVNYTGSSGFPWFLPDGEHFLFASWGGSGRMTIRVGSLGSTENAAIGEADSNAIYAGGRLLYLSGTSLMAQPFDLKSLRTSGGAEPIAEGVQRFFDLVSVGAFSASSSGLLAYQTGTGAGLKQLTWFDRAGKPIKTLGDRRAFFSIELSPDGRNLVASAPDTLGNYDLWLFDVERGLATRFTSDPGGEYYGVWSPDGRSVILNSTRKGHYDLFRGPANSAGSEGVLYASDRSKVPTSWSPDGKSLLYFTGGGRHEIFLLPLTPERSGESLKPEPLLKTGFNELFGQFSPDGRWVLYSSDVSGQSEIYVTPLSRPSERHQISTNGGGRPRWRRDGKELYYIALDGKLMAAETRIGENNIEAGPTHALLTITGSSPASAAGYPYEISADGQRILTSVPAGDRAIQPVTLVQNWTGALKK